MGSASTNAKGSPPSQFRLSLSVNRGNENEFDLWRFGLSPMFAVDARDPADRKSFGASVTSYQFADIAIAQGSSSAATFDRTGQTIARSGLDNICLFVHPVGGCELDAEGGPIEIQAGDICILDLSRRSRIVMPDYHSLSVILPRALVMQFLPNVENLHGLVLKSSTALAKLLINHLRMLFAEAPSLDIAQARAAAGGTSALIATFAGALADQRHAKTRVSSVASLQALRQVIDENLANPDLGPEFLARRLAISRATLYRLFDSIGGVREYIQLRRLTRAYRMITDPALVRIRVGSIATECGFRSDTVFGRAFREAYGMTPTDLRKTTGTVHAANIAPSDENGFVTMNRWLIGMDAAGR